MGTMIHAPPSSPHPLIAHPSCDICADWRVSVSVWRELECDQINILFVLPRSRIQWTEPRVTDTLPARVDELWKHSCVELFIGTSGDQCYREFNFSLDGRWAAYDFSGYRERISDLPSIPAPKIFSEISDDAVCLQVKLKGECLPCVGNLELNATAVLEKEGGSLSYWAAHHPCAQPDFHHRAGFVLALT